MHVLPIFIPGHFTQFIRVNGVLFCLVCVVQLFLQCGLLLIFLALECRAAGCAICQSGLGFQRLFRQSRFRELLSLNRIVIVNSKTLQFLRDNLIAL